MKYVLMLNDMREPHIENLRAVKVSNDRAELAKFVTDEKVPPYRSEGGQHGWSKVFREGGPLEWFNAPHTLEADNDYWGGIWTAPDAVPDEVILASRVGR